MKAILFLSSVVSVALLAGCGGTSNANNANVNINAAKPAGSPVAASSPGSTTSAEGEVYRHEQGGIQFTVPKGWKTKSEGEMLTVSTGDDSLSMVFWVPAEQDFEKAVEAVGVELAKVIKDPNVSASGEQSSINGLDAYSTSGTGEVNGAKVEWDVTVLDAKKPVCVVSFADPANFKKNEAEYDQFIKSIKKL